MIASLEIPEIPHVAGQPAIIGKTTLAYSEGEFRVYTTELEILWRWDLYKGERHLHTGCAHSQEGGVLQSQSKIRFFLRPNMAALIMPAQ
ncbi:MAG: hypothetical protein PHT60_11630 [Acidiphilium sp.]|nr:hypothetical protein [Acidiphilium sp.]MDD4936413.1 hypothetical protein [Acidiphilium sp.]